MNCIAERYKQVTSRINSNVKQHKRTLRSSHRPQLPTLFQFSSGFSHVWSPNLNLTVGADTLGGLAFGELTVPIGALPLSWSFNFSLKPPKLSVFQAHSPSARFLCRRSSSDFTSSVRDRTGDDDGRWARQEGSSIPQIVWYNRNTAVRKRQS